MPDPQVVWLTNEGQWYAKKRWCSDRFKDKRAIVMTPEYRAELRKLVDDYKRGPRTPTGDALAAAIERMLEVTE